MIRLESTGGVTVAVHHLSGLSETSGLSGTSGTSGRPRLLFAHATGFHSRCYQPIADSLGDRFECFGVDFRGHGETPAPAGWQVEWTPFGADAMVTAAYLAPPEGIVAVGHSMGGAALLMAAARRPRLFERLVLYEPIAHPPQVQDIDMEQHPIVLGARRRRRRFASFDDAYDNFSSKPPLSTIDPAALRAYVEHGFRPVDDGSGEIELRCSPEIEAGVFRSARRNGVWDLLSEIDVPTLVVAGAIEEQQPSRWCRDVAERLPLGTYIELPHLSHFGPFTHPGDIAGLIA